MNDWSTADPRTSGSIARRLTPSVAARRALAPLVLIAVILSGATYGQTAHLQIYHINVEQGDATLFLCPDGRALLIDGGNTGKGRNIIVPLLQTIGVESLDYVIATHYDADHIGGLDEVVDALGPPVIAAWDRGDEALPLKSSDPPTVTRAYAEYVRSVGRTRRTIRLGERFEIGGVQFTCVAVNGRIHQTEAVPKRRLDENARSVALRVKFGEFDYFTAGDLTGGGYSGSRRTADVESLAADQVADVDVLHVNHHGSSTSSCERLLDRLRPEVAVISVGTGGVNLRYRHPSRNALDRLHDVPSLDAVFQTSRGNTRGGLTRRDRRLIRIADSGTPHIVLHTDGRSYVINGAIFAVDERAVQASRGNTP